MNPQTLLDKRSWLYIILAMAFAMSLVGCAPKPIQTVNITQTWFNEQDIVRKGIPLVERTDLRGKKVFLSVQTEIPDEAKLIHDVRYDNASKQAVPMDVDLAGGIRQAVDSRIRSCLQTGCGVVFVQTPEAADIKLDVHITNARMDTLEAKGDIDMTRAFEQDAHFSYQGTASLNIESKVNGETFVYGNAINFDREVEAGKSVGERIPLVPGAKIALFQKITGNYYISHRKLSFITTASRTTWTYVVVGNRPDSEGLCSLTIFDPDGKQTMLSIDTTPMTQYSLAASRARGDWEKLGQNLKRQNNKQVIDFAPYDQIFTSGPGQLVLLIHDYINQLQLRMR